MSCVTPADLGKPITAIVERCGPPDAVTSLATSNTMVYVDGGQGTMIWFDADQMRARIVQFNTYPPAPAQPLPDWAITLPFESGARAVVLGQMTLADAQSTLAVDADVTTQNGAAFRSTPQNDIVLTSVSNDDVLGVAFVGERASLVQSGLIASPLDTAPLAYRSPVPRDAWLRPAPGSSAGTHSTIFRVDVDAEGIARKVTVVTPSGDAAFDASTRLRIGDAKFHPATLDQRPVSGAIFVQIRH